MDISDTLGLMDKTKRLTEHLVISSRIAIFGYVARTKVREIGSGVQGNVKQWEYTIRQSFSFAMRAIVQP